VIHLGQHLHAASPLKSGSRENLVLWLSGLNDYVRTAPYYGLDDEPDETRTQSFAG